MIILAERTGGAWWSGYYVFVTFLLLCGLNISIFNVVERE